MDYGVEPDSTQQLIGCLLRLAGCAAVGILFALCLALYLILPR